MRLSILGDMMREFNYRVANNLECTAWKDFVADCQATYGMHPQDIDAQLKEISDDFATYWSAVSRVDIDGATSDYNSSGWFIG